MHDFFDGSEKWRGMEISSQEKNWDMNYRQSTSESNLVPKYLELKEVKSQMCCMWNIASFWRSSKYWEFADMFDVMVVENNSHWSKTTQNQCQSVSTDHSLNQIWVLNQYSQRRKQFPLHKTRDFWNIFLSVLTERVIIYLLLFMKYHENSLKEKLWFSIWFADCFRFRLEAFFQNLHGISRHFWIATPKNIFLLILIAITGSCF